MTVMVLFVMTRIANVPFDLVVRACLPFLATIFLVVVAVWFLPQLALWLPGIAR